MLQRHNSHTISSHTTFIRKSSDGSGTQLVRPLSSIPFKIVLSDALELRAFRLNAYFLVLTGFH